MNKDLYDFPKLGWCDRQGKTMKKPETKQPAEEAPFETAEESVKAAAKPKKTAKRGDLVYTWDEEAGLYMNFDFGHAKSMTQETAESLENAE